jgi:chromate transporter
MPDDSIAKRPTPRQWFLVWLRIGLQSFGGGVTTITLIRQELVERGGWITADEYTRDFALCQLSPGVNILGMAVIFGKRLLGPMGVVLAVGGLLVPSATITACLTAAYAQVKSTPMVAAALRCVMPAVAGLGVATAVQTAQAPMKASRNDGWASILVALTLIIVPAWAVVALRLPTVYALAGGATLGSVWVYGRRRIWRVSS